jgi:hypothetical protein
MIRLDQTMMLLDILFRNVMLPLVNIKEISKATFEEFQNNPVICFSSVIISK